MAAGILIIMHTAKAQTQCVIQLKMSGLPAAPVTDAIYLCGKFNGWNPHDENHRLQKDSKGNFFIVIEGMETVSDAFKFTRGSWDKVETGSRGEDLPNRVFAGQMNGVHNFSIAGWKDGFTQPALISTASAQVRILDSVFPMPQLGSTRRIWVYLPKEYENSRKKYPVLYMHDGQNLFDDATAFAGEWGIDETMDALHDACIVVGIDNGGVKRMNEYNPNNSPQFGKGEGKAYLSFIVSNLKPFIDKKYRTLIGHQHTYMAGSSMGGLISFYAGLYYPEVFGVLGIFSPSFWVAPQIRTQIKQLAKKISHARQKYYFYAGGLEGNSVVPGMKAVADELKQAADPYIQLIIDPQGKHNEATWAAVFPQFYKWVTEMSKKV